MKYYKKLKQNRQLLNTDNAIFVNLIIRDIGIHTKNKYCTQTVNKINYQIRKFLFNNSLC
jgi:hypothetical protein